MTDAQKRLVSLIDRSIHLHEAIHNHVDTLVPVGELRAKIAFDSGVLALEHGTAVLHLVEAGWTSSAFALMRPQFESLVRGIWLAYAASDSWIEKLSQPLTVAAQKQANEGPMVADMLKQLEVSPDAPGGVVGQLKVYRDVSWKALNSFNHGGIHALSRNVAGYPHKLVYDALRNSNAVVALTAQLLAIMTGDGINMDLVRQVHVDYVDCLPIVHVATSH